MVKSLLSDEKVCYVCKSPVNIHKHHIYYGSANRKLSEEYGCFCYLCYRHHNGSNMGVHFYKPLDTALKWECQRAFENKVGDRSEFMRIFGQNYL